MIKLKPTYYLLAVIIGLCSCQSGYMHKEELEAYVSDADHEVTKEREYKGYKVQVTYKPSDLLILQENNDSEQLDSSSYSRLYQKYHNYYYFILELSRGDKEVLMQHATSPEYTELVQTLSFRMGQYVNLTTSERDTIPVGDYTFPRTFGMGSSNALMFAFSKADVEQDEWLKFNLQEFGLGLGIQSFRFDIEKLESTPRIEFKITDRS